MAGTTAGASRWALSAGTLVLAGGLALFQLTSLVLGPAGSRQLHLSLAIPAVAVDDPSESSSATAADRVLGTLRAPDSTPAVATAYIVAGHARRPVALHPTGTAATTAPSSTVVDEKAPRAHKSKPHRD